MMGIIGFLVGIVGFLNGQLIHLITETKWEHGIDYINKVGHFTKTIFVFPLLPTAYSCHYIWISPKTFWLIFLTRRKFLGNERQILYQRTGDEKGQRLEVKIYTCKWTRSKGSKNGRKKSRSKRMVIVRASKSFKVNRYRVIHANWWKLWGCGN